MIADKKQAVADKADHKKASAGALADIKERGNKAEHQEGMKKVLRQLPKSNDSGSENS